MARRRVRTGKRRQQRGGTEPDASRGKTLTMTNDELMQRESARAGASDVNLVMIYQDAFAADYQDDEYMLLGMAIKYAGLRGKEVRVIGKNRQTLGEGERIQ
jgi:hypothetical protein